MEYQGNSIVDYLKASGQASDFTTRASLAKSSGIANYTGSAEQNTALLAALRTKAPAATPVATPAPKAAAPVTPTPQATPQPTPQATPQATPQSTPQVSTPAFVRGQTGSEVQALQATLVQQGYMTPAEVATGPGTFGPKTEAAYNQYLAANPDLAPQQQTQTSSTDTNSTQTSSTDNPSDTRSTVQVVIDEYSTAYKALGLGDIKTQYESFVEKEAKLAEEKASEISAINNNPWLSQGVKDNTIRGVNEKYQSEEKILTAKVALLDSLYKQGQIEVGNIVNKSEARDAETRRQAFEVAQKKQEALDKLLNQSPSEKYGTGSIGEYNFAVSQGYKGSFTQYQNEDANRKAKASGSGTSTGKTLEERKAASLADLQNALDSAVPGAGTVDPNGYITTKALKKIISAAPSQNLTGNDVIEQVQNYLSPNFDKKGNPIPGTVNDSYGLTLAQKKLLGITP